jgi:tetratricopeptide (TPR) repeat protein
VPEPGPDFLFSYADTLVAAERYEQALALADRMTVAPHRELIRGRVALESGSPEQALKHFSEGLRLWPDNAVARYFAATAAERIGDFDRAIEEYRYSIRANASATDARLRLARLYSAAGDDSSALEVIRHDSARKPHGDLKPTLLELEILARLGQTRGLPEHVVALIRPPERWARAVAALAAGTRARSGPAAAAKVVLQADRLDLTAPLNAPALSSLVRDLIDTGHAEQALALLDSALRAHPEEGEFHAAKGLALSRSGGDTAEVRAAWERTLELEPQNAVALRGLAGLEAGRGETEAALALYRRATDADPEDTAALRESAEILAAQGRRGEAERELETLLERDPYDGAAALRLAQLLQLRPEASRDEARIIVLLRAAARFGAGAEVKTEAESLLERFDPAEGLEPTPQ